MPGLALMIGMMRRLGRIDGHPTNRIDHLIRAGAMGLLVRGGRAAAMMMAGMRRGFRLGHSRSPSRSEEHTSELQSLMRISYAVFCLKKTTTNIYYKPTIA